MYTLCPYSIFHHLFRPHLLQFARAVDELSGVGLGNSLALVGLLHKVLVALLVGEVDRVLLGVEVETGALHHVGTGLPAHERVLPSVALGQHVPVDAPLVAVPVAGLSGGLCGAIDAGFWSVFWPEELCRTGLVFTGQFWLGDRWVRRTEQRRECQDQARSRP